MKPFILLIFSILFLAILQTSFAQKYEYTIEGNSFADTLLKKQNNIKLIVEDKVEYVFEQIASNQSRKVNFEDTNLDSNYVYHKIGEGESIEYILNLYQICAPCFAEWNNFELKYKGYPFATEKGEEKRKIKKAPMISKKMMFDYLKVFDIYEDEYLKVALKKDYQNGTAAQFRTRKLYVDFPNQTYIYDIARKYKITQNELRAWNNLSQYAYEIENMTLIVGEVEYKYTCPCLE